MGYVAFSDRSAKSQGTDRDFDAAQKHWVRYAALAQQLIALEPKSPRSFKESAYAQGALCGLQLERRSDLATAMTNCKAARLALEQAIALDSADVSLQLDLANRLAWEAEALAAGGQPQQALAQRRRQIAITEKSAAANPQDAQIVEADMLANLGTANLLTQMHRTAEARQTLLRAAQLCGQLTARDPSNRNWAGWNKQILQNLEQL